MEKIKDVLEQLLPELPGYRATQIVETWWALPFGALTVSLGFFGAAILVPPRFPGWFTWRTLRKRAPWLRKEQVAQFIAYHELGHLLLDHLSDPEVAQSSRRSLMNRKAHDGAWWEKEADLVASLCIRDGLSILDAVEEVRSRR